MIFINIKVKELDINYDFSVSDNEITLTDDYCPVDSLCDYQ